MDLMVDEVTVASCTDCSEPFVVAEGGQGRCASCCALLDEHEAGAHRGTFVEACRDCWVVEERHWLPATA